MRNSMSRATGKARKKMARTVTPEMVVGGALRDHDYHHDYIAHKRPNTRRAQAMHHLWDQYDNGYWRCPDPWGKAEYEISLDDGKYNLYVGWPDDEMIDWEREPELEGTFPTLEDAMLYTEDNWLGQGREYSASRRRASRRSFTAQTWRHLGVGHPNALPVCVAGRRQGKVIDMRKIAQESWEDRVQEVLDELSGSELLAIIRQIPGIDGSFDNFDTFDFEDVANMMDSYDFGRAIVYGDVTNVMDPVRFNAYGNLVTVTEWELEEDAEAETPELAWWLVNSGCWQDIYDLDGDVAEILEVYETSTRAISGE